MMATPHNFSTWLKATLTAAADVYAVQDAERAAVKREAGREHRLLEQMYADGWTAEQAGELVFDWGDDYYFDPQAKRFERFGPAISL